MTRLGVSWSYLHADSGELFDSLTVKIENILALPNMKILLFLQQKDEARYSELSKLIKSRGALSNAFKELIEEELIQRRIDPKTRPVKSYYSLTKKGKEIAQEFAQVKSVIAL